MPLSQWGAFYREHEAARLRDWARMVGVVHPKNPRQAQRDLLRAAARISGEARGIDLLADPRRLRERLRRAGLAGVAIESRPPDAGGEGDG